MPRSREIRDRLLSAVALGLCTVAVSVSVTALEASVSTGIAPAPPGNSPRPGLSLQALLFLLLNSILSVFGISLDSNGMTLPGGAGFSVRVVLAFLQLVYRYRILLFAGVVVTVFCIGYYHRDRSGPANGGTLAGDPTGGSETRMPDDRLWTTPSNPVEHAWIEMIEDIDINDSHARTLGEWETAAIETGLDPAAVRTITTLFAEVQYGAMDVTLKRRREAQKALSELTGEETIDR